MNNYTNDEADELIRTHAGDQLIFAAQSGSRLYGLDNEDSDHDYIAISASESKFTKEYKINEDVEYVLVDYKTFMNRIAEKAPHQYIDALASNRKILGPQEHLLSTLTSIRPSYSQIIRSFVSGAFGAMRNDQLKRFRFGLFLATRANNLGMFDPEAEFDWNLPTPHLTEYKAEALKELAESLYSDSYEERKETLRSIIMIDFNPERP